MQPLDTTQTIETPEGVEFEVHLAGPISRVVAALIDLAFRGAVYFVMAIPLALLGEFGVGLLLLAMFVLEWGYPIYFEMYKDGATPGKRMMDLQVTNADGTPINWKGSILRNLLRTADFMPLGYAAGIITMSVTGRFQRLGDLAGDTVVCYRQELRFPTHGELPDVAPRPVAEQLSVEEQRAIVQYAHRSKRWNYTRNAELARILEPLTATQNGTKAISYLQGLANWITRWS
ncbi:MAG: RDD family protein [Persicimonas sp.]